MSFLIQGIFDLCVNYICPEPNIPVGVITLSVCIMLDYDKKTYMFDILIDRIQSSINKNVVLTSNQKPIKPVAIKSNTVKARIVSSMS